MPVSQSWFRVSDVGLRGAGNGSWVEGVRKREGEARRDREGQEAGMTGLAAGSGGESGGGGARGGRGEGETDAADGFARGARNTDRVDGKLVRDAHSQHRR